ncbi:MAG TPA: twin-arginine translocase TatA/TatE family subunit [Angustibacter sp.]|nr:twin-arginine translocase TatA/TatE family subunit [Angustibacter sp.]
MFDINGGEFLILVVVALVVLGPERLPQYAQQLGRLVREARGFAVRAREQVRNEMGEEFDDVDWKALDPRQYDPRRIVREALLDGDDDPLGLNEFKQPSARLQDTDDTSDLTSSDGAASPRASRPRGFDADAT